MLDGRMRARPSLMFSSAAKPPTRILVDPRALPPLSHLRFGTVDNTRNLWR